MKIFNMVLGTTSLFDTKCEYISRCDGYRDDSYTCTEALDKNYCGTYKIFLADA